MDKEKLAKNHFWILWILALILLPVIMAGVWMGVASATEKKRDEVKARQKALDSSAPKGQNYIDAVEAQKKELEVRKIKDWQDAYQAQKGLIEWPTALQHLNRRYFGDEITDEDRETWRKGDVYIPEFESLADLIKPTELAGGWQQVLRPVKWGNRPTVEDAWLAIEDLCIQREMLRCIHAVNELLAQFRDVTNDKDEANKIDVAKELKETLKPVEGETVQRFVSPYWQLDLAISRSTQGKGGEFVVRGKIKNISHRRLNIARIDFLLTLVDPQVTQSRSAVLPIEGDYLAVGKEIEFQDKRLAVAAPKPFIYAVEQKLDHRYVPVKRLDKVVLGYHSHRTIDKPLVLCKLSEETKKTATPEGTPASDPNAPPPTGAAAAPTVDRSSSGIERARYVTCTDQVRRMPIGVVVTVDQAHVQDVLRAFANSRLRFQTTQMHLTHASTQGSPGGSGLPAPHAPAAGPGGIIDRPVRPLPGMVPQPPAMTTAPGGLPIEEANSNLVEMAIYGLASIYEKYPPKGKGQPTPAPTTQPNPTPTPPVTPAPAVPSTPSATPPQEPPASPKAPEPKEAPKPPTPN